MNEKRGRMKPIKKITIETIDGKTRELEALFDSGSFYTIVREDKLPKTEFIFWYPKPKILGTAHKRGKIQIMGATIFIITIDKRKIEDGVLICSHLSRDMLIGAKTMQAWDISIHNENGQTKIKVGRDIRDPEITEVA